MPRVPSQFSCGRACDNRVMSTAEKDRSFDELTENLRQTFAGLSPQFQTATRFLLDHPDEVAVSSMRTIAGRANVQPATLVRLAQSLGYPGWQEVRRVFIQRLRSRPNPYAAKAKALLGNEPTSGLLAEMFRAHRQNLDNTEAQIGPALPRAAQALTRARTVHIAGFRACYPIAFALLYVYRLFRPSVLLIGGEGGTMEMQLRAIGRDDALVVVSFAPYSSEARRATV